MNPDHRRWVLSKEKAPNRVCRDSVSVFINFMSKRIHRSTLREAFGAYRKVLDVYVAYNNPRRSRMKSTLAFVRFTNMVEALRAVKEVNGQRMDGFSIKVFLERKYSEPLKNPTNRGSKANMKTPLNKNLNMRKVGVSYKEALLNNFHAKSETTNPTRISTSHAREDVSDKTVRSGADFISISVSKVELEWLKMCFVGQIKSGFYAITRFKEEEQMTIFWDMKESLLDSWFADKDTIDNFMNMKKLRIWDCFEGIPIMVWQESVFKAIVSRRGNVIRMDDDTARKSWFDVTRILVGLSCLSDILSKATIVVQVSKTTSVANIDRKGQEMQNPTCNHCQRRHLVGHCWKQCGACFYCGGLGHFIRDYPKNTGKPQNVPVAPSTPAQSYQSRGPRQIQSGTSSRGRGSSNTPGRPGRYGSKNVGIDEKLWKNLSFGGINPPKNPRGILKFDVMWQNLEKKLQMLMLHRAIMLPSRPSFTPIQGCFNQTKNSKNPRCQSILSFGSKFEKTQKGIALGPAKSSHQKQLGKKFTKDNAKVTQTIVVAPNGQEDDELL
ncbi:hypothetical protein V6N12_028739 [Hibiscus sabdariffa]|uniref:RRM domain-containing protein n=1 Tax=Hibiscus sabdariffa TaxID=183260 RepID=A0ABR2F6P2_9ROSI